MFAAEPSCSQKENSNSAVDLLPDKFSELLKPALQHRTS